MVSDKRLFEIVIKYHSTFIGALFDKQKILINDGKFVVHDKSKPEYIKEFKGEIIRTENNGVKQIKYKNRDGQPDFALITVRGDNIKTIIERGIELFRIHWGDETYCLTSQIEDLIIKCYDIVDYIKLPEYYLRFKGEVANYYLKLIECRHRYLIENNYRFCPYSEWGYVGKGDITFYPSKAKANILKFGMLAYRPVYEQIEWTFELVEKYKDILDWKLLIEKSNLIWEEERLMQYDKYIPYCIDGQNTYCEKFYGGNVIDDYTKLGFLSNEYIEEHKDKLNWMELFRNGNFCWNSDEMEYFFQYAISTDLQYATGSEKTSAASQIKFSIEHLINNVNFHWTRQSLYAWLSISEYHWKEFINKPRPKLFQLFLSIPNIKELASPHINHIKNFWDIVGHDREFPYDELTKEFTIDNIKINIDNWSTPLENKYYDMRMTADTTYFFYHVVTQWDIFLDRINIPLTYELAKALSEKSIKFGGTYQTSEGGYIEGDKRFPIVNGLEAFSSHHIASVEDCRKCLEDETITDILLGQKTYANKDLIDYVFDCFFKDFKIENYLDIINCLKDWDTRNYIFERDSCSLPDKR